jgi:DNA-binding NarL/FixJ family response regulator
MVSGIGGGNIGTRVMIVDDQAVVRAGFAAILGAEPDLTVVGEAGTGEQALAMAERERPDVVLMDIRMPGMDGLTATERITAAVTSLSGEPVRVLVLTTFGLDEYVFAALRAGASGFLLKDAQPQTVIDAVRLIAAGEGMIDPAVTRQLISAFVNGAPVPPSGADSDQLAQLTERELDVLRCAARGLSNAEIAAELVVSTSTVKTHMNAILGKLQLRDRVQATIFAYETGLIRPGSHPH